MVRKLFLISVTGFWLTMMTLLIQKEFFGLAPVRTGYDVLSIQSSPIREEYMAYFLGERRMGFGQTVLIKSAEYKKFAQENNIKEDDELQDSPFTLRHSSYLTFLLLGRESEIFSRGQAELDESLHLMSYSIQIRNKSTTTDMAGEVSEDGTIIEVAIEESSGHTQRLKFRLDAPLMHAESILYLWTPENLKLGKRGRFRIWNPLTLAPEEIEFHVSHKTHLDIDDERVEEVFVIIVKKSGVETRAWVTPEGDLVKMETPTGIIFRKEPAWKIFDGLREQRNNLPDLPNLYSIPSNLELESPENLFSLKAKLRIQDQESYIENTRQSLDSFEDIPYPLHYENDETLKPYLASSQFIQADNPLIQTKAREIIESETDALMAVLKLTSWVNRNVTPYPTSGIPSATQVLDTLQGDCNEYTVLFTALARSAGIPTRMQAGLVYHKERFFYHAWPEVYLNGWFSLDPTLGQTPSDVTHIPLVEGPVQRQMELLNTLGSTTIQILEIQEN